MKTRTLYRSRLLSTKKPNSYLLIERDEKTGNTFISYPMTADQSRKEIKALKTTLESRGFTVEVY
jgi:hypothetical protein